jgi:hypothetical protein
MRVSLSTTAKIGMILGAVLFSTALPAPAMATGSNGYKPSGWDHCSKGGGHYYCKKTTSRAASSPSSTEIAPSICDGQLGFWVSVPMPGGAEFCVAKSTADFYHNDGWPGSTNCTVAKIDAYGKDKGDIDWQKTFNGACKTPGNNK